MVVRRLWHVFRPLGAGLGGPDALHLKAVDLDPIVVDFRSLISNHEAGPSVAIGRPPLLDFDHHFLHLLLRRMVR